MNNKIIAKRPPKCFIEGFPMGNGSEGTTVLGSPEALKLVINHEWLWTGYGKKREAQKTADHLDEVRELILNEKFEEGTRAANMYFSGPRENRAGRKCSFVPAGEIIIDSDFEDYNEYLRFLDIENGLCEISFLTDKYGAVKEQGFVSSCDKVAAFKITSEKTTNHKIRLYRKEDEKCSYTVKSCANGLTLNGELGDLKFNINLYIKSDGEICVDKDTINIKNCKFVELYYNTNVLFENTSINEISINKLNFDTLKERHINGFKKVLGNASFKLNDSQYFDDTFENRLEKFKNGGDISLPVLFFNYAKYLAASSALGDLPMNLQGVWNEEILPPWNSDYHLDINLQMNYWFAPILGMDNIMMTYIKYIEECFESGRTTAKNLYNCRGICFPLNSDAWHLTTPESYSWDVWVGGALWIAEDFYRFYEFTDDINILKNNVYPFLKELTEFIEDYVIYKDGKAIIVPSSSPENSFKESGGFPISMCKNSAMDVTLFKSILHKAVKASEILSVDENKRSSWLELSEKLPDLQIGSDGRLLEWDKEYAERELGHRHFSHLYGIYPGDYIKNGTALAEAGEKSLKVRLDHGAGQSGWSRSWTVCLYARLHRAEMALENLKKLICDHLSSVMMDLHPHYIEGAYPIFQIDGNLGGTAGICEMLIQSDADKISVLPSCPKEWESGAFNDFKAVGNIKVSTVWKDGAVKEIKLFADDDKTIVLDLPERLGSNNRVSKIIKLKKKTENIITF